MYILARIVNAAFEIMNILIIARVIISWVQPNPSDQRWVKLIRMIYDLTEPILGPIRELLPTGSIGIDFSPLVAIFALSIIRSFLVGIII